MGRRTRGFVDEMAELPWPVALAVGVLGFGLLTVVAPVLLVAFGGAIGKALAAHTPLFTLLGGGLLVLCCMAAISSYLNAARNRRLLDTRSNLDSLAALGWRDFERLVGEAFRRQGYEVEATGLGGADGGIDLILRKHGRRILVQCKHWRRNKVPINVVREMVGLLAHHNAEGGALPPLAAQCSCGHTLWTVKPDRLVGLPLCADRTKCAPGFDGLTLLLEDCASEPLVSAYLLLAMKWGRVSSGKVGIDQNGVSTRRRRSDVRRLKA